jgi:hypothetical protein
VLVYLWRGCEEGTESVERVQLVARHHRHSHRRWPGLAPAGWRVGGCAHHVGGAIEQVAGLGVTRHDWNARGQIEQVAGLGVTRHDWNARGQIEHVAGLGVTRHDWNASGQIEQVGRLLAVALHLDGCAASGYWCELAEARGQLARVVDEPRVVDGRLVGHRDRDAKTRRLVGTQGDRQLSCWKGDQEGGTLGQKQDG